MMKIDWEEEYQKCLASAMYFIHNHVWIYSADERRWIRFRLWRFQAQALQVIQTNKEVIVPKSRQMGFTWLARAYMLHQAIFWPVVNVAFFSKSDPDAKKLLSLDKGFRGMYERVPAALLPSGSPKKSNEHEFVLPNGSMIEARPYTQAESDTYSHVLLDEADRFPNDSMEVLVSNLEAALEKAQTIIWGSIIDKERTGTLFQNTVRAAMRGESRFKLVFFPWHARPDRDQEWYDRILTNKIVEFDDEQRAVEWMQGQYPGTIEEALASASSGKRVPGQHVDRITVRQEEIEGPEIEGARYWVKPVRGRRYVIGCDPAEGVGGDESVAQVLDAVTGEQVAMIAGQLEPKLDFPRAVWRMARVYGNAGILVELNNHGTAVIGALEMLQQGYGQEEADEGVWDGASVWADEPEGEQVPHDILSEVPRLLADPWASNATTGLRKTGRSKAAVWDHAASAIKEEDCIIHDRITAQQVKNINRKTLKAPDNEHDDRADGLSIALVAADLSPGYIVGDVMV